MAEDANRVNQQDIRAWHERTFPGLTPMVRATRIYGKFIEESAELEEALNHSLDYGDGAYDTPEIREEAADVLIALMGFAEFAGFNLFAEAIRKHNINNNRVWDYKGLDSAGLPQWERVKDTRPESLKG